MTVERMVDWMDTKLDQKMAEMSVDWMVRLMDEP